MLATVTQGPDWWWPVLGAVGGGILASVIGAIVSNRYQARLATRVARNIRLEEGQDRVARSLLSRLESIAKDGARLRETKLSHPREFDSLNRLRGDVEALLKLWKEEWLAWVLDEEVRAAMVALEDAAVPPRGETTYRDSFISGIEYRAVQAHSKVVDMVHSARDSRRR